MMGKFSCVVLGAGGFIGTNLCRRLVLEGFQVRAFGRTLHFPESLEGVEWTQGDFGDLANLASIIRPGDIIFHLVHSTTPQGANLDMLADLKRNVVPSLELLNICRTIDIARIVFISSGGTVYGCARQIPTSESAPTEPITAYGVSKLTIEKYLGLYHHLYGLDSRVMRVSNPFGPFQVAMRNQGVIAALISRAIRDETFEIWGDGSVVRDFVFIDDVIDALVLAGKRDRIETRVFNIGSGEGRSLRSLIHAVENALNKKLKIKWMPARRLDVPRSVLAIDRAREVLGWRPKTNFETGLARTIEWWLERSDGMGQSTKPA
jgi:UDP-glucose 4-epimerase